MASIKRLFTNVFFSVAYLTCLVSGVLAQAPAGQPVVFTEKDREFALKYLGETRDEYVRQMTDVSDAQLNFRAAEGRWTIAEIAEHITVVEEALFGMLTAPGAAREIKCQDIPRVADTTLILSITNRAQKFTAPEQVRPNGRWKTRADLLASFEKARTATTKYIKDSKADLRGTFVPTPAGTLDSFQGILFISGHADRHLAQLREVKADANYPKN